MNQMCFWETQFPFARLANSCFQCMKCVFLLFWVQHTVTGNNLTLSSKLFQSWIKLLGCQALKHLSIQLKFLAHFHRKLVHLYHWKLHSTHLSGSVTPHKDQRKMEMWVLLQRISRIICMCTSNVFSGNELQFIISVILPYTDHDNDF